MNLRLLNNFPVSTEQSKLRKTHKAVCGLTTSLLPHILHPTRICSPSPCTPLLFLLYSLCHFFCLQCPSPPAPHHLLSLASSPSSFQTYQMGIGHDLEVDFSGHPFLDSLTHLCAPNLPCALCWVLVIIHWNVPFLSLVSFLDCEFHRERKPILISLCSCDA